MNRRVMAVTAAAVMSMSGFAVPAMADEEEAVSIQISASIMSMDPLIGGDSTNVAVISNTMEGLFVVDADGQIQNGLCDSYEVSDDQKTYTFHIRDNAKWSDGTPVTAQDFEYAWKRNATAQGDYSKFTYQIEMAAIKNYEAVTSGEADADELGVTAVDDNTLQVELEYPVPFFLNLLYGGALNTFAPISYMDRSKITLIRPMIYIPEKEIRKFIRRNNIEVMPKVCPMDGKSKREDMKILISDFEKQIPTIRANLVGAIKRGNINGWKE